MALPCISSHCSKHYQVSGLSLKDIISLAKANSAFFPLVRSWVEQEKGRQKGMHKHRVLVLIQGAGRREVITAIQHEDELLNSFCFTS